MKPQLQKYLFNDGSGRFGDCHRTCIAMIFDMERDDVPHFMANVPPNEPADGEQSKLATEAERAWAKAMFNMVPVSVPFHGSDPLESVLMTLGNCFAGTAVILGCQSANGNHSVVVYDGEIYNPHGEGTIVGPMRDGWWWVTIYAHATKPLPAAQPQASVAIQEDN